MLKKHSKSTYFVPDVVPPGPGNPPIWVADFESGLAPARVEAHPYGPPDTTTTHFGTYTRNTSKHHRGTACGHVDLPAYSAGKTRGEFKTDLPDWPMVDNVRDVTGFAFWVPVGWDPGTTSASGSFSDSLTWSQLRWSGSLQGSPVALRIQTDHLTLIIGSGPDVGGGPRMTYQSDYDQFPTGNGGTHTLQGQRAIPPSRFTQGRWHEILTDVFWTTNPSQGWIKCHHRISDGIDDWVKTVDTTLTEPLQFATLGWSAGQPLDSTYYKKWGPYRWSHSDAPFSADCDSLTVFNTIEDAKAWFGPNVAGV